MTEYTIRYHTGDKVLLEYDHAAHSYVVDELKIPNVTTLIDGVFPKYLTEGLLGAGLIIGRPTVMKWKTCIMASSAHIRRSAVLPGI